MNEPGYELTYGPQPQPGSANERELVASEKMAWVLDDLIRIPGTNIGIGADALLGMVPVLGDASTTVFAGVIMVDAMRHRVSLPVLARMGINLGIDALIGLIPFIGDFADIANRANQRNFKLLQRALSDRKVTRQASVTYLICAAAIVACTVVLLVAVLLFALWMLLRFLGVFG